MKGGQAITGPGAPSALELFVLRASCKLCSPPGGGPATEQDWLAGTQRVGWGPYLHLCAAPCQAALSSVHLSTRLRSTADTWPPQLNSSRKPGLKQLLQATVMLYWLMAWNMYPEWLPHTRCPGLDRLPADMTRKEHRRNSEARCDTGLLELMQTCLYMEKRDRGLGCALR